MFDHLSAEIKARQDLSENTDFDGELELQTEALENWSPISADILLEQQLETEADTAAALASVIKEHGPNSALLAFVDHDKGLSNAFGVESIDTVSPEDLVTGLESLSASRENYADSNRVHLVESLIGIVKSVGVFLFAFEQDGYRLRLTRYRQAVRNKTWSDEAAKDT